MLTVPSAELEKWWSSSRSVVSGGLDRVSVGRYDTSADSEVYRGAAAALLMLSVGPDLA